jgi:hypothetical protein
MKLTSAQRKEISSATIAQTLILVLISCGLFALTAYGADPAWWSSRGAVVAPDVTTNGAVVTTNYLPNDYAVVTQGQLKQFTARAVNELNANLSGGAGTNLNSLMSNWAADYATNGYNATNIEPADYTLMNVGQLKYIGNKVWARLVAGGYTTNAPSWLAQETNSDNQEAIVGQLKELFDFSLTGTGYRVPTNLTVVFGYTSAALSWTDSGSGIVTYTIQGSTDGGTTWSTLATVAGTLSSTTITGLTLGDNYKFQIIANYSGGSSTPSGSDAAPLISLLTPADATLVP